MMKNAKFKMFLAFMLALIPTISAYGGYSTFSISQFTNLETILTAVFFLLVFYGFKKVLGRVIPNSNAASSIVALVLSLFAIVGLNKMHFSYEDFLYNLGMNRETLFSIAPWILLALVIFIFWKWGFAGLFLISSGLFFVIGLLGYFSEGQIVYNWQFALIISGILFLIGLWLWKRRKSKGIGRENNGGGRKFFGGGIPNPLGGAKLALSVGGRRYIYPRFRRISMDLPPGGDGWITIENIGNKDLIWKAKTKYGASIKKTRGILVSRESIGVDVHSNLSTDKKLLIISAKGKFGNVSRQRMTVIISPGKKGEPSQDRFQRKTRLRSKRELQQKHDYYSNLIKEIQRNNNGKIPKRFSSDGKLRHRYWQAMNAILKLANDQGFKLR